MVSYDSLIDHFAIPKTELQKECSNDVILEVSENLTEWRAVAPYLEISDAEVQAIDRGKHMYNEVGKRQDVLQKWKAKFQYNATYEKLIKGFLKAKRADLARIVAEQIKKGRLHAGCARRTSC